MIIMQKIPLYSIIINVEYQGKYAFYDTY